MKLLSRIEKSYTFWSLLIISGVFFILRLPSLFEPYWYGDEGIYQAVAMLVKNGAPLYSGAWENKPPLLLIIYALLNSDQFLIRGLSLIFGLVSIWFFYFVAKKLFPSSKYASIVSTAVYAVVFGTRIIEGNIANAENFMLLPILAAAALVLYGKGFKKSRQMISYFSAGLLLSFAFLIKIVAIFDFLAFGYFIFITSLSEFKNNLISKLIPFALGFLIPIILTVIYFFFGDHFKDFTNAFLVSNVGYVGINNVFIIPQGLLILKASLLAIFSLFVLWKRNKIHKSILFILIWFSFALFDSFFSQRPYTHYLIMLLPAFCLMIGAVIEFKKEKLALFTYLLIAFLTITFVFDFKGDLFKYYENFALYMTGGKDTISYQAFFDKNTPRDYEIAMYIKANTDSNDKVFIWGNNAQVYKLAEKTPIVRYTVAYHITFFPTGISDMTKAINEQEPKLIVIMPNAGNYPLNLDNYSEKLTIEGAKIYEKIF